MTAAQSAPSPALRQEVDRLAHDFVDLPPRDVTPGEKLSRWRLVQASRRRRDALIAVEELPTLQAEYEAARAEAAVFFPDEVPA